MKPGSKIMVMLEHEYLGGCLEEGRKERILSIKEDRSTQLFICMKTS
jgi:hypothetical protein